MLHALLWGFSLPLLFTSQVHIGRLVFIVPVIALIVAVPIGTICRWLAKRQPRRFQPQILQWGGLIVGAIIVLLGAVPSLQDWRVPFETSRMVRVEARIVELTSDPPTQQLVYVFGDGGGYEVEGLRIAELEILLDGYLRFEDLTNGNVRGRGPIPLLYGAVVPRLGDPGLIPGYCTNLYLVEPGQVDQFLEATTAVAIETCGQPLNFNELNV